MSPDDRALEDLLYCSDLGDEAEGVEGVEGAELGGGPAGMEESAAADNVSVEIIKAAIWKVKASVAQNNFMVFWSLTLFILPPQGQLCWSYNFS